MFCILSILAKLDKADRAFCFTSGMAALTAVVHLLKSGAFSFLTPDLSFLD
jgi:cystathionine beta-lyase/cystathionine gamma-synthase